jgi:hypothetical protein
MGVSLAVVKVGTVLEGFLDNGACDVAFGPGRDAMSFDRLRTNGRSISAFDGLKANGSGA